MIHAQCEVTVCFQGLEHPPRACVLEIVDAGQTRCSSNWESTDNGVAQLAILNLRDFASDEVLCIFEQYTGRFAGFVMLNDSTSRINGVAVHARGLERGRAEPERMSIVAGKGGAPTTNRRIEV
jgi:hypothetical protein